MYQMEVRWPVCLLVHGLKETTFPLKAPEIVRPIRRDGCIRHRLNTRFGASGYGLFHHPVRAAVRNLRDSVGTRTRVPATDTDYGGTEIDRCSIHGRRGHHSFLSVLIEAVDGTRLYASCIEMQTGNPGAAFPSYRKPVTATWRPCRGGPVSFAVTMHPGPV